MIKVTASGFPAIRMNVKTASVIGMILNLSLLFIPSAASACSCAPITAVEHLADSTIVFKGTIVERKITTPKDKIFGNGAVFDFKIEKSWKGNNSKQISVEVPTIEGSLCGFTLPVGWSGVVFAGEDDGKIITSLCAMLPYHRGQPEDYDKLLPGHR